MSGYLQRLASSALKPGGSIHPVLGSIFSRPDYGRMPDAYSLEEDIFSGDEPPHVMTPRPEGSRTLEVPRPAPVPSVSSVSDDVAEGSRAAVDPKAVPRPAFLLVPPRPGATLLPDKTEKVADPDPVSEQRQSFLSLINQAQQPVTEANQQASDEGGQREEPIEPRRQGRDAEVALIGVYKPLMAETTLGNDATGIVRDTPNWFASASGGKRTRDVAHRSMGLAGGEPDEIQIHIGRIEVTAVPQSPVPRAAKPAPKSVSLDEYLKRRDGRAL
jgi:hypothetical protein